MSCSHTTASSSAASAQRAGARLRARVATPWTWDQRRGRARSSRARARPSAHTEIVSSINPRLGGRGGTFTDAACRLETSGTSLLPRPSHQIEAGPDDPAAAGAGLDSPAVRASQRFDHVQAVRAAVGLRAVPGAAEVFGFDPDVIGMPFGADGEELALAG